MGYGNQSCDQFGNQNLGNLNSLGQGGQDLQTLLSQQLSQQHFAQGVYNNKLIRGEISPFSITLERKGLRKTFEDIKEGDYTNEGWLNNRIDEISIHL